MSERQSLLPTHSGPAVGAARVRGGVQENYDIRDDTVSSSIGFGPLCKFNYAMTQYNAPLRPFFRDGTATPLKKFFGNWGGYGCLSLNFLFGLAIRFAFLMALVGLITMIKDGHCIEKIVTSNDDGSCSLNTTDFYAFCIILFLQVLFGGYVLFIFYRNFHIWRNDRRFNILNSEVDLDLGQFTNCHVVATKETVAHVFAEYAVVSNSAAEYGSLFAGSHQKSQINLHFYMPSWNKKYVQYPLLELTLHLLIAIANIPVFIVTFAGHF